MYYIYHVFGKKIGVTRNLTERVITKQGYHTNEFEILDISPDIDYVSKKERELQKLYGYKIDRDSYKSVVNKNQLNNKQKMKLNVTEQTITFPCPVSKLKGQLMDALGLNFETQYGKYILDQAMADWIVKNASMSMFNSGRSYVYNKALDNWANTISADQARNIEVKEPVDMELYVNDLVQRAIKIANTNTALIAQPNVYNSIREWAHNKGIYTSGDSKTQYVKLIEEAGELAQAILKRDKPEIKDAIGDMIVVLTNLAHLEGFKVEDCVDSAYDVIKSRTGKMENGTFVKSTL
jgi:NTP pyrophosphatase (non-canonical NTP hydrolase)